MLVKQLLDIVWMASSHCSPSLPRLKNKYLSENLCLEGKKLCNYVFSFLIDKYLSYKPIKFLLWWIFFYFGCFFQLPQHKSPLWIIHIGKKNLKYLQKLLFHSLHPFLCNGTIFDHFRKKQAIFILVPWPYFWIFFQDFSGFIKS